MALPNRYIQYLKLPTIPQDIIGTVIKDADVHFKKAKFIHGSYCWSDFENEAVNKWCQENICSEMYFGFQIFKGNAELHKDIGSHTKIVYLIQTGGSNVRTEFFKDDGTTLLDSYCIETNQWHILKADTFHHVMGVEPGQVRLSITGRIFAY